MRALLRFIRRTLNALLVAGGLVFFAAIGLAFTDVPWQAYDWLATDSYEFEGPPEYVVVLGGGGIPSESGLIRTYHAAVVARAFDKARVIVALPGEEDDVNSALSRTRDELVLRGVGSRRIVVEDRGRNTREQALNIRRMLKGEPRLLVVTSPEHTKRALLAFRKAGFGHVSGGPAFNEAVEVDLAFEATALGGQPSRVTDAGFTMTTRYRFWNNLGYLGRAAREYTALGYYWVKGWI